MEKNQNSIKCACCDQWVHAPPNKKCSNLDINTFLHYTNPKNKSIWYCPTCVFSYLPDANLDLFDKNLQISDNINLQSDQNLQQFITSRQNFSFGAQDFRLDWTEKANTCDHTRVHIRGEHEM